MTSSLRTLSQRVKRNDILAVYMTDTYGRLAFNIGVLKGICMFTRNTRDVSVTFTGIRANSAKKAYLIMPSWQEFHVYFAS